MPDVLFIIPPGWPELAAHHEATSGMGALVPGPKPFLYPPHTVATCAAVARSAGLETAVWDATLSGRGGEWENGRMGALPLARSPTLVVAVLVSHGTAHADENFLRLLQHTGPRRPILLFGPSAHFVAGPWLEEGLADAALLGEPEGAITEAVKKLTASELGGVAAAATLRPEFYSAPEPPACDAGRSSGSACNSDLSELPFSTLPSALALTSTLTSASLDALPFPAWDLVPWQAYGAVSLLSSRGCPAGCAYCAYTVAQGHAFRAQSPERTVAELAWLAETIRPPRVQVRDPVFAHDRARVVAICEGVLARGLKLNFACESRPEHFDDELLRLLKAAGCTTVKIGLESGDPALLQRLGRVADAAAAGNHVAEAARVARTCHKLGITCQLFVMAGLPGQDATSLARTEAFLRRLPPETAVHVKPPHPGTVLTAPAALVLPETLARLEQANRPQPAMWRRAWHLLRPTGEWENGREGERGGVCSPILPLPHSPTLALSGLHAFLTGGNGFLGGHVARALVAAGAQVVALVRPGSPPGALADLPVEIARGDLTQPAAWAAALHGCALCFHVAALYGGADQAEAMYAVNAGGTSALLAACKAAGVRRVVYTGTIGTVGRPADPTALPDETTPFNLWDQASHYVRSKYLGELIARSWAEAGLEVVIVKPTAPVGAGDARPSATGRRILAALRGEVVPYPPGGVNHVPVWDVAAGHLLAAQFGVAGQTYILGHKDGNLDHAAFLRLVADAANRKSQIANRKSQMARMWLAERWTQVTCALLEPAFRPISQGQIPAALTADPSRAIRELGLPQSDLRAAFVEAVVWFVERGRPT